MAEATGPWVSAAFASRNRQLRLDGVPTNMEKVAEPRDSATCEGPLWLGYGATQATFRAGAKPTGTTATSFIDATSTTETLFVCELAT